MRRTLTAGGVVVIVIVVLALAVGLRTPGRDAEPEGETSPAETPVPEGASEGVLYGRVTTDDGVVYEGRLRFGGDEEAFWDHYFNGVKRETPWAAHVPRGRLPTVRDTIEVFGIEITVREREIDLSRPFMARFGDIARIEADGGDLRVTLKSGSVVVLDRSDDDDLADGVRVWDARRGVVDIDDRRIRTLELLPAAWPGAVSARLHGTVRTADGAFTGFVQWDRAQSLGSDELEGRTADGRLRLRFDAVRSIERRSGDSSLVTLLDGREMVLSGTRDAGDGNRGIFVDDPRSGRVLVSWDSFERVDFSPGGPGPAYADFAPGRALAGGVVTRSGRRIDGRLVFDLDESETTETLDAPSRGVEYAVPFGRIASIVPRPDGGGDERAVVTLRGGEALRLEKAGDLGEGNAGMLIFVEGSERPEYVPWSEVERVDLGDGVDPRPTR